MLDSLFLIGTLLCWFNAYVMHERWSRVPSEDYSQVHPDNVEYVKVGVEKYKIYSKKMIKISRILSIIGFILLIGYLL
jgi:hypothetical protein